MDEEKVRKRCIELTAGWLLDQGLVGLVHSVYRTAYADGLEAAAKVCLSKSQSARLETENGDLITEACANAIRQHAKEMGHE